MDRPNRSRHGLTRCRACRAHIHTAARPSETSCPFCGNNQLGIPNHRARSKIVAVGRGGLLAAGLVAFSAMGCGETNEAPAEPVPVVTEPIVEAPAVEPMQPMQPGDVVATPEPEPEPEPEPIVEEPPPEPIAVRPRPPRPRPDPVPVRPADPPIAVPAYGVAPPDEWETRPAPDMRPMARYGLPPMRDRVESDPG